MKSGNLGCADPLGLSITISELLTNSSNVFQKATLYSFIFASSDLVESPCCEQLSMKRFFINVNCDWMISFFVHILFHRLAGSYQHDSYRGALLVQRLIQWFFDIVYAVQQFQPIAGLARFLQCNLQFGNEILFALRVLGFIKIGADGCPGTSYLICDDGLMFCFQVFYKSDDPNGEVHG